MTDNDQKNDQNPTAGAGDDSNVPDFQPASSETADSGAVPVDGVEGLYKTKTGNDGQTLTDVPSERGVKTTQAERRKSTGK